LLAFPFRRPAVSDPIEIRSWPAYRIRGMRSSSGGRGTWPETMPAPQPCV